MSITIDKDKLFGAIFYVLGFFAIPGLPLGWVLLSLNMNDAPYFEYAAYILVWTLVCLFFFALGVGMNPGPTHLNVLYMHFLLVGLYFGLEFLLLLVLSVLPAYPSGYIPMWYMVPLVRQLFPSLLTIGLVDYFVMICVSGSFIGGIYTVFYMLRSIESRIFMKRSLT